MKLREIANPFSYYVINISDKNSFKSLIRVMMFILLVIILLPTIFYGQHNFVHLSNQSGVEFNSEELDSLEAISSRLKNIMPVDVGNHFKVFDFAYYSHDISKAGGKKAVWEQVKEKALSESMYYLLIGRFHEGNDVRIEVDIKLPAEDYLLICYNMAFIESLSSKLEYIGNKVPLEPLYNKEYNIVAELINLISCCEPENKSNCGICDKESILIYLRELRFFAAFETELITDSPEPYGPNDYAQLSIDGVNIAEKLNDIKNSMPGASKVLVTKDENICFDNNFETAKNLFNSDLLDFDIWVHVFTIDTAKYEVMIKFEHYFDLEEAQVTFQESKTDEKSGNLDPISFNLGSYDPDWNEEYPHYIVQENGESFTSIVELYEYEFFYEDLERWNPNTPYPNNLNAGDKIYLFKEEYDFEVENTNLTLEMPVMQNFGDYIFLHTESEIVDHLQFQGLNDFDIYAFTSIAVVQSKVALPAELINGKYIVDEVLDELPEITKKVNPKWFSSLPRATGKFLWFAGRAVNVIALVLLPTSGGQPTIMDLRNREWSRLAEKLEISYPKLKVNGTNPKMTLCEELLIDEDQLTASVIYCTYTKFNPNVSAIGLKPGRVYIGRTRGLSNRSPCQIVAARNAGHGILNGSGYSNSALDTWVVGTKSVFNRHLDPAYWFHRGRENLVIGYLGGPITRSGININGTRARNIIWGMAPLHPMKPISELAASFYQVGLYQDWDGVDPDPCGN